MTCVSAYSCDLCKKIIDEGTTIIYMPDNPQSNFKAMKTYHLSSIKFGLHNHPKQVSTGGAVISHICLICSEEIYDQYLKDRKRGLI